MAATATPTIRVNKLCTQINNSPGSPCKAEYSNYGFLPELWTGIVFCCLFALNFFIHCGLLAYHRGFPKFMIICIVAAAGELGGWIARTYGHHNPFDRNGYIAQIICLILSPAFISAVNYIAFQHTMDVFGKKWSRIPRKYYVIGFCFGDLCSLVVQAVGGALSAQATTRAAVEQGKNIMIAGVTIQIAVTAPFLLLFFDYNLRRLRDWKKAGIPNHLRPYRRVEVFAAAIGFSSLFVLIRCIYRIVEMADGWLGYLATTEVYFDILDGLMITIAIAIFIPFHPGWWLPRGIKEGEMYDACEFIDTEKPQKVGPGISQESEVTNASSTPSSHNSYSSHSPA